MFAVFLCLGVAGLTAILALALSNSAFADTPTSSTNLDLSVNVTPVISIRTLDSTATTEINSLDFNITPTSSGVRNTNTTVVDVSTSNVSGYNLLMQSDYRTDGTSSDTTSSASFTTSLINTDPTIATETVGQIPTATTSAASSTSYWNYTKSWNETLGPTGNTESFTSSTLPVASTDNQLIPAYNTPTTIRDDVDIATASSQTNIDINVDVATDKSAGAYKNKLVFTAIANPIPVDYTLTFDKNTTDTVENLPSPLTATAVATSHNFVIPTTTNMTRSGYQFVGWSTSPTERQGSGSGPDGLYVAGDTYTVIADDPSQPDYSQHGTGSGTLYAVWALEYTYTLNYSCQSGATNCPATQSATTINTSHTFTIPSTTPTLDGYNFINYTDNGAGTGNTYNPGDTITLTSTANTKTLTANFEEALPLFWRISTMQEMTPEVCASVYTPSNVTGSSAILVDKASAEAGGYDAASAGGPYVAQHTLSDIRDSNTYTVRKLADGNCWMVENLRYDLRGLYDEGRRGVGSRNDGSTFTMTDANLASGVTYYTTTVNAYNAVITPNTTSLDNVTRYSYSGNTTGTEYYYTWTAATAGQGTTSISSSTVDGSICPAGWRLPANYTDAASQNISWNALADAYPGSSGTYSYQILEQVPINLYRAGRFISSSFSNNTSSFYWSGTAASADNGYYLHYHTTVVILQNADPKSIGFQVRCIASR